MATFITEDWLKAHHSLSEGTELQLPADSRLTPSARELINARHLRIKYYDEQGRLFVDTATASSEQEEIARQQVHGLTSETDYSVAHCQLCGQGVKNKPDTLTHLDAETMVVKNDPRLLFRAKLDNAIAQVVWLQIELQGALQPWLADIRSVLGNIMRADALHAPLESFAIGGLSAPALHQLSHHPLKYLGHDHIVPRMEQGRSVALLNLLRTQIRETEVIAAQVFIGPDFVVRRPDIMQGLNRLSSTVYVLMLLCLVAEKEGKWPDLTQLQQLKKEEKA